MEGRNNGADSVSGQKDESAGDICLHRKTTCQIVMTSWCCCFEGDSVRGESFKATIEDAAMNTGAHGIANVYRTKSFARKIFWALLVVGGLG